MFSGAEKYDTYLFFGLADHFNEVMVELGVKERQWCILFVHDEDVSAEYYNGTPFVNRHGISGQQCWEQIDRSELFVAQNRMQLKALRENFNKDGILVKSPIEMDGARQTSGELILWVGRPSDVKRPELFVQMAKAISSETFLLITNDSDPARLQSLRNSAPENLEIMVNVPANEIETHFARAKLFVSTAISEGFPITFLHAGKFGVPIATLGVDPDQFLTEQDCGFVYSTIDQLIEATSKILMKETWSTKSRNISRYVAGAHDAKVVSQSILDYVTGVGN